MTQVKNRRKVVKTLAKGQVTIPSEFREILGIEAETLLSISLVGDHLEIVPLAQSGDALRRYTDEDIARFLEEDKLDQDTALRVRALLRSGAL
ncbi:MAG: Bifunctional DNA-binding transcriptional regulator of stationary/sporulation/toxin gene expression and antitoxin component of the YhaV-PrlF toxin-antitoxin module [Chloroflexi bacterium]|jgi:AbrB family looped-hinge helix DNA binding protein|nr:MAG: Bifunctional DNA-binding transcriptional regulator of stationary/sporulation/toxin gene expression and antitoxin component of the YhaV-PrlF toxin-antitoxin module [Chloroflexota bacterium]